MAEKTLSEISRDVRLLYQKGNDALIRENYDYAIDLFNQVLDKEPGLFDCRKALRTAQTKKAGGGGGFFKKMLSSAGSSPLVAKGQLALRRSPTEALGIAEQILNSDPTNSAAHRLIVDAATTLEMPKTIVQSLEVLVKNSPKDKHLAIQFANALVDIGEAPRAEKFLQEVVETLPYDQDLLQALKNLSARKTMGEKGYKSIGTAEGSYREMLRDKDEAVALEQEKRVLKTEDVAERLIGEYEAELQKNPNHLKRMRDLAELYTQKKQFEKALQYYERIKASDMGRSDASVDAAMAQTKVKRYEHQLSQLDPNSADYADAAAKLKAEKLEFQIAECQARVERFPTDLAIRFEMGTLYYEAGKIGEAIQEFQKAQGNPHKRIAAMNFLALCFAKRKMFDMAARKLQEAIKEKVVFDDEKKDLTYNLGLMFENMGKKEEALEQFKTIYEMDIAYRDVQAKVDAYYSQQ